MTVTDITEARARRVPHDLQAEASLLGAMLLSKDAVTVAAERLRSDDFHKPGHGHTFEAILSLFAAGEPVDPVSVVAELERAGLLHAAGGNTGIIGLYNNPGVSSNAAHYVRIIEDCAALRRLIAVGGEVAELGYDGRGDPRGALDQAEARVFELTQRRVTDTTARFSDLLDVGLDRLEQLYERGQSVTGLPTGFIDLDDLTGGLQPGALYVLGGRPGAGKTSLALNIATHTSTEEKSPTLMFSLEMSHLELTQRILCAEAQIDSKRVRNGQLYEKDWARITAATGRLADAELWIDDDPGLTIMELRSKARRLKSKVDLGLIVVDYLQLMSGRRSAENRQVEVAEISRGLKVLARELECPVLALSQLSRNLESRDDKRPRLSDLRETGALEQDSDVVLFCYRDEVYNKQSNDRGTAEIIVAKHRNGPVGQVRLAFHDQYTKFNNLAKGA